MEGSLLAQANECLAKSCTEVRTCLSPIFK
jgi:hypothetical protein